MPPERDDQFLFWLKSDRGLSNRGACDVRSRVKRLEKAGIDISAAVHIKRLNADIDIEFANFSSAIRSQLKRAALFSREFQLI